MTRPTAEIQMTVFPKRPIPDCYWVQPNLCAGEYSGAPQGELARLKLRRLLAAGITLFLDLTEAGESGWQPVKQGIGSHSQE